MLFPTVNKQNTWIITGIVITVAVSAVFAFNRFNELSVLAITATPTKTSTRQAAFSTTTTPTGTPTNSPTTTNTATSTPTKTSTSTSTPILHPPTATSTFHPTPTFTLEPAITAVLTETPVISAHPTITSTLELTFAVTLTATEPITPVGTPTPTPTPVPRTIKVPDDIPDYTEAQDHFWFTRAFTEAYKTRGSYYYPYGTNGLGQYFWHYGIDIENPQSTTIIAAGAGTVAHAGTDDEALWGPSRNNIAITIVSSAIFLATKK